jgi:hypothetical protein
VFGPAFRSAPKLEDLVSLLDEQEEVAIVVPRLSLHSRLDLIPMCSGRDEKERVGADRAQSPISVLHPRQLDWSDSVYGPRD